MRSAPGAGAGRLSNYVADGPRGYLWMPLTFPKALREVQADIALLQYMGPFSAPCPFVTTIHDTVWRSMRHTFPWRDRLVLDTFIPGTIRRAAAVTTGSQFAAEEILRHYPQTREKLRVVPYGVDDNFARVTNEAKLAGVRERYRLPEHFILSVGVLQPRKNVAGLIEAYTRLPAALRQRCQLVIAGKRGWLDANLPRLAAEAGPGIVFIGYVDDADLPALYSLAACFAYPSLYEGFGLPPLEAMACGTPVVTSDRASLPEVTGGAAVLVDPEDAAAMAKALERVLTDDELRGSLIEKGRRRAAELTWAQAGEMLLKVLEECLGR